jgi:predicted translin family RNA/ssDNA-binding protein
MIDKEEFTRLVKEIEEYDAKREDLIKKSREILKLSKQIIYSVHRNEIAEADGLIDSMKKEMGSFGKIVKGHQKLLYSGTFKITVQEYVEALAFYELIKNRRLPRYSEVGVDPEFYLLGICDLTGEIVRKAINSAIKEDYKAVISFKEFVSELYGEFMKFDFSNGELRKKYDSIKYDLKKLEDLALELKLKGRI